MKIFLLSLRLLCVINLALSLNMYGQSASQNPLSSSSWYKQAVAGIEKREYYFRRFSGAECFVAANHGQYLGFQFTSGGYTVKNFHDDGAGNDLWQQHFSLESIGRPGSAKLYASQPVAVCRDTSLQYVYRSYTVEYVNDRRGMRQNFIIRRRPEGPGAVQVTLRLSGDLEPRLEGNGRLLLSSPGDPEKVQLIYDEIRAWDACHRQVPARMILRGKDLVLSVDDAHAVYPVTVDPLNHTAGWTGSGQGLVFPLLDDLSTHVLYGYSVSGAGDVNGDSFDDLIIGVPAYVQIVSISGGTFNPVSVGAAFIYYGSGTGPSLTPDEALQPTATTGALFGLSVSTAGDVNGDGKADVVIGAPGERTTLNVGVIPVPTSVAVGKVYVYYGSTFDGNLNTTAAPSVTMTLTQADMGGALLAVPADPLYGFSVANAGDVNGDGFADVIVGCPGYRNVLAGITGGRADIYYGSLSGLTTTPGTKITNGLVGGLFGYSVSTAGKVNNDTYDDVVIGAPGSISLASLGAAYVFHGSASGVTATSTTTADATLQPAGLLNKALFGSSVAAAGDVNGDGRGDIIVGAPLSLETAATLQVVAVGQAYIFYGSNTGVLNTGFTTLTSPRSPGILGVVQGNLLFGFSVAGVGDVNGDLVDDVMIGEPGGTAINPGTGILGIAGINALSGQAYLYYGKAITGPDNTPGWTLNETGSLSVANLLGASVHAAGDVNGDGKPDVVVGAPNGTLDLSVAIPGIVGTTLSYLTTNSIGSAYSFFGTSFTLPVTLLAFDGKSTPEGSLLSWSTSRELNSDHFEVQRSADGVDFSTIGHVEAGNNSTNVRNYTFTDASPLDGKNYYRLKMVDLDARYAYSQVIVLSSGTATTAQSFNVYPNPVSGTLNLHFTRMPGGDYELMLINSTGQTMMRENITLADVPEEVKTRQRPGNIVPGTYMLQLVNRNTGQRLTYRVVFN